MKSFIHDDFLLQNEIAKTLYHRYAKDLPIIDYHCHLDPKEIYQNKTFKNISDAWLSGDHYKWRLMRAHGINEDYITGTEPDQEKFKKWAEVIPHLLGNPLYHWTHLELKRYFDIDTLLSPKTAEGIYQETSEALKDLPVRKLIDMSKVELICTTDDPTDSLEWHERLANDPSFKTLVKPAFRPDKVVNIDLSWFNDWVNKLEVVVGYRLTKISELKRALIERLDFFHQHGSRLSDHGLDVLVYEPATEDEVDHIYQKRRQGLVLTKKEVAQYRGHLLVFFGKEYHKRQWVQQYHIGALRNISTRHLENLGPDTGFDAINDQLIAQPLAQILNELDKHNELPKTILYTLNPRDFEVAITIMGAFQGGGIPGKIQFGSAWWFLDTIDGMTKQMKALANNGLLSRFVGMLTDSRSYLSYPRHEYFRRLVCHIIGEEVEQGLFPYDETLLGQLVQDICYYNAKNYFGY